MAVESESTGQSQRSPAIDGNDEGEAQNRALAPREREGPRNEEGKIFCDHVSCTGKVQAPTFKWKSDWR